MTRPVAPGSTIGILGGGQLGRMTAMAARSLGYHIHVLDPEPECAARPVADVCVTADFDDAGWTAASVGRSACRGCWSRWNRITRPT